MKYLHNYKLNSQFREEYINDEKYKEPWVGFVKEDESSSYNKDYLTFEILSDGDIVWMITGGTPSFVPYVAKTLRYSINGGRWNEITSTTAGTTFHVSSGDVVRFEGSETTYPGWAGDTFNSFSGTTAGFNVSGDIKSLIAFGNIHTGDFAGLFHSCSTLVDAGKLKMPSSGLTQYCFYQTFSDCTSLVGAPSLPAMQMISSCYEEMFYKCTALKKAPELPATTLASRCYHYMFGFCSQLEKAPALNVLTLCENCYAYMFWRCTSLTYVKCLATDISASNCTANWIGWQPSSGTFVKNRDMNDWTIGSGGIPDGWTVEDA